jgi:glutamine phosphoribosylpyrophosphate amidotransferase
MCGLTAIYHSDSCSVPSADELVGILGTSLNAIDHRGPDSHGIFISDDFRVGEIQPHMRLLRVTHLNPLQDLGIVGSRSTIWKSGNQPLSDEDGMIQCVVTGELYDHERIRADLEAQGSVFKTKSDSEIGMNCPSLPKVMFGLIIEADINSRASTHWLLSEENSLSCYMMTIAGSFSLLAIALGLIR